MGIILDILQTYRNFLGDGVFLLSCALVLIVALFYERLGYPAEKLRALVLYGHIFTLLSLVFFQDGSVISLWQGAYTNDTYAIGAKIGLIFCGIVASVFSFTDFKSAGVSHHIFYPLLMIASVGGFLSVSATNFYFLLVGLTLTVGAIGCMNIFIPLGKTGGRDKGKILIAQVFGLLLLSFSVGYIYHIGATFQYESLAMIIREGVISREQLAVGVYTLIPAIGILMGTFPFGGQFLSPFRANHACVAVYVKTALIIIGFIALGRLLYGIFSPLFLAEKIFIVCIGVAGMVVGALCSLMQEDMDALCNYVCMGHVGFLFLALGTGTVANISPFLLCLLGYVLSYIAFVGYGLTFSLQGRPIQKMQELQQLRTYTGASLFMYIVSGFAFAGMVPSIAFFSKILIFKAFFDEHIKSAIIFLVSLGFLQSIWVFRLLFALYFTESKRENVMMEDAVFPFAISAKVLRTDIYFIRKFSVFISIFFLFFSYALMQYIHKMSSIFQQ